MLKTILKPILLVAALLAASIPLHAQKTVRVDNATGALAEPTNFWTANAAAISSAISLSGYQPLDADLTSIASLATQSFGRSLLTQGDEAAARTTLGLTSAATGDAAGLTSGTVALARLNAALAGLGSVSFDSLGAVPFFSGPGAGQFGTFATGSFGRTLSSSGSASEGRTYLGLTSASTGDASGLTSGTLAVACLPALTGGDATTTAGSGAITLATVATAGTYRSVTVDAKGRTTAGTNPTTIAGYGLTDAASNTRTITAAGLATGGGSLAADRTITVTKATPAQVITGTDDATAVTPLGDRAALTAYVDPLVNTRAMAPHFVSDGVTTDRGVFQAGGTRNNIAGAPVASWVGWVDVPSANPAASAHLFVMSVSASPADSAANHFSGRFESTGTFATQANGTTSSINNRRFAHTTLRALYSGQRVWMEIRYTQGTTNPVVRVNGTDLSAGFTLSTAGTPPAWLDAGLSTAVQISGYLWPAGIAPAGCWINGHLTDAESETWRLTGRPPAWVVGGGSVVNKLTSVFGNSGGRPLDTFSGASATAWTAIKTQTVNDARLGQDVAGLIIAGRRYRVEFNLTLTSGTAPRVTYRTDLASGLIGEVTPAATAGANSYEFTCIGSANSLCFEWAIAAVFNGSASGIKVTDLGALSLLRPQVIPVADDWTQIGGNTGRLVGMVGVTDDRWWRIVADVDMSSTGNKQLLGGAVFNSPDKQAIDSVEHRLTGTPTFSLGDGTATTRYTASAEPGAGRTRPALSSPFPTSSANTGIYCNVTATGGSAERITITGHTTD